MNKKNIKIYIATHKKFNEPNLEGYIPIQVGASLGEKLPYLADNSTPDNISSKNKNYCELTALYWIWKNDKSDIVGLTHYRRYFYKNKLSNKFENLLDIQEISEILENYDIILPKQFKLKYTIEKQYQLCHQHVEDLHECGKIIEEKYPEYVEAFNYTLKQKKIYACNMFITKKEKLDNYMQWLFDILFELEKRIDITEYNAYNQRVFGFLSERLFNVWIHKNNDMKIKEMTVYNTEKSIYYQWQEDLLKKH